MTENKTIEIYCATAYEYSPTSVKWRDGVGVAFVLSDGEHRTLRRWDCDRSEIKSHIKSHRVNSHIYTDEIHLYACLVAAIEALRSVESPSNSSVVLIPYTPYTSSSAVLMSDARYIAFDFHLYTQNWSGGAWKDDAKKPKDYVDLYEELFRLCDRHVGVRFMTGPSRRAVCELLCSIAEANEDEMQNLSSKLEAELNKKKTLEIFCYTVCPVEFDGTADIADTAGTSVLYRYGTADIVSYWGRSIVDVVYNRRGMFAAVIGCTAALRNVVNTTDIPVVLHVDGKFAHTLKDMLQKWNGGWREESDKPHVHAELWEDLLRECDRHADLKVDDGIWFSGEQGREKSRSIEDLAFAAAKGKRRRIAGRLLKHNTLIPADFAVGKPDAVSEALVSAVENEQR